MRKYETIIVFAPDLSEAQVKQEMKRFEGVIQGKAARSIAVDQWGKKDLAYYVKKSKTGRFVCLKYEVDDHSTVEALTNLLRLSDSVLKSQTHRINEKQRKYQGNPKHVSKGSYEFEDSDSADQMDVDY